jgi:hypothetical protein
MIFFYFAQYFIAALPVPRHYSAYKKLPSHFALALNAYKPIR